MHHFEKLRAKNIQKFREVLPSAIEQLDWSRDQIQAEQTRRLRLTLANAKANSPFYAERLSAIDPATFELADLPRIPPITKAEVMENWDRIVTDPALTLEKANEHLAAVRDGKETNAYFLDKYYLCATGGSSGHRGLFVWDAELYACCAAITFRMESKLDLLNPPTSNRRTAVICAGSYLHASRMLFPSSNDPEREIKVIPAGTPIAQIVTALNAYQPDRIISYSSVLEELCAEAVDGRLNITPNRISANSEPLTEEAREAAKKAWGIDIHNQWGSVEVGVAGSEGEGFEGLVLAEDFCVFEAADEAGNLITEGPADHLIVTRLYGTTMPMIRYVLTDSPIITPPGGKDAPGCRRITEIRGRADIWFTYADGHKVHPMVFREVLGQYASIIEYQVHQTENGAKVDLITHQPIDSNIIEKTLRTKLSNIGLFEPKVDVSVVDKLERHPETNKLMRFVALKA
ncbi:hypothetical protein [Rubellicoccus peritrichatus]|uniref:Phenylacetate-CoA ligase n=1 Tax=Rubellicoccus peritrichatus TaxID=3080537 RepID=A0AAQ3QWU8_9BACT|nr:hypothetical protein [Puniceicoccus sp. CR14]WOO42210.1 hypothetical protein RZN69_03850 [Puniceicoccus sp. CR14]